MPFENMQKHVDKQALCNKQQNQLQLAKFKCECIQTTMQIVIVN